MLFSLILFALSMRFDICAGADIDINLNTSIYKTRYLSVLILNKCYCVILCNVKSLVMYFKNMIKKYGKIDTFKYSEMYQLRQNVSKEAHRL